MRNSAKSVHSYVPALDGLRGICILGVLLLHAAVPFATGGFLGVDGFFTLSGYLITSLLLMEYDTTGAVSLKRFYLRRALRLFPALFVLLMVVSVGLLIVRPSPEVTSANVRGIWSSLLYVSNWVKIVVDAPESTNLGLLGHTWSLAIEEQFYLLWPLILVLLLRSAPHRLLFTLVLLITASWAMRATLTAFGVAAGSYRTYSATDTRADSLLIGCLLAVILARSSQNLEAERVVKFSRIALCTGLPVLAWMWALGLFDHPFFYLGGFTLNATLVALIILNIRVSPQGKVARLLSYRPLRAVGVVSYGLYLWHWPIFQIFPAQNWLDWQAQIPRFVLLVFCVVMSYRYVEVPFLRLKEKIGRQPTALTFRAPSEFFPRKAFARFRNTYPGR